ncbi:holin family protein [Roseibacterium sp. SDUM158017]|uniref:holin family protein n=1 Tax=Roseicyclus salinarum TaxID=3036773 RepID=UPI0024154DED|nr:holin family protein [Roseibacterium sp. SDUM158017]MDG4648814.1 holin family protein [Roseibacterium sp. SDUM158017]
MGLIGRALASGALASAGEAAEGLSEVFVANATRRLEVSHDAYRMALEAAAAEYAHGGSSRFDRLVNGLNRLPRPLMALGTIGLFAYAMADPPGFAARMIGLSEVPEPLWWLLGAIVGFYFGAREFHYLRRPRAAPAAGSGGLFARLRQRPAAALDENPALSDWAASRGDAP